MYLLNFLFSNLDVEFRSWQNHQKMEIKKQLLESIISNDDEKVAIIWECKKNLTSHGWPTSKGKYSKNLRKKNDLSAWCQNFVPVSQQ